jgi:hypothetical protein
MSQIDEQSGETYAQEAGRRQALYREVNERLEARVASRDHDGRVKILCECGLSHCSEQIVINLEDYERLRLIPTRFAVVRGHSLPAVERVIEENGQYDVVEKFGESAIEVIKLDPRRTRRFVT